MQQILTLLVGTIFGIVLVKGELASWERIRSMFLFQEAHMYLVITTAIIIGVIAVQILQRTQAKSVLGEPLELKPKPFQKGVIIGGFLFGMGWAITGACPGPIYAQIGAGSWAAGVTLLGALAGMYGYAVLQPRLPH